MKLTICKDDCEVIAVHDIDADMAHNIIATLQETMLFMPWTDDSKLKEKDTNGSDEAAHAVLEDLVTACRNEMKGAA